MENVKFLILIDYRLHYEKKKLLLSHLWSGHQTVPYQSGGVMQKKF